MTTPPTYNPKTKRHPSWKTKGKGGIPDHVTAAGTCKYQTQGPVEWGPTFKKIAEKIAGPGAFVGVGIRAVLAAAMGNEKLLESIAAKAKNGAPTAATELHAATKPKKPAAKKPSKAKPAAEAK